MSYRIKEFPMGDYRVIKIWVQEAMEEPRRRGFKRDEDRFHCRGIRQIIGHFCGRVLTSKLGRLPDRIMERTHERALTRAIDRLTLEIRADLSPRLDEKYDNYVTYDGTVSPDSYIRKLIPLEEFDADRAYDVDGAYDGKKAYRWSRTLLPHAQGPYFVVLGRSGATEALLWDLARRMKALYWLIESADYAWAQDFAEEFYYETGLAIELSVIPSEKSVGQCSIPELFGQQKVSVLDFLSGNAIPIFYPAKGSIWIDFFPGKEKHGHIRARGLDCELFYLRKQWKNLMFA